MHEAVKICLRRPANMRDSPDAVDDQLLYTLRFLNSIRVATWGARSSAESMHEIGRRHLDVARVARRERIRQNQIYELWVVASPGRCGTFLMASSAEEPSASSSASGRSRAASVSSIHSTTI